MTTQELSAKTVIELRKLAKANGVTLGAGVSKSDIVAKLAAALADNGQDMPSSSAPVATSAMKESPVKAAETALSFDDPQEDEEREADEAEETPMPEAPKPAAPRSTQPQFRAAWHNPAPRYSSKPAYQAPAYPQRQGT